MAAALSARSEECAVDVILKIDTVVPIGIIQKVEFRTSEMFKDIGVDVRVRTPGGPQSDSPRACGEPIVARLVSGIPLGYNSHTLAYASPFATSGPRIHVFVNRIMKDHCGDVAQVLTHVLAHEITHVIEGIDHHSDYGLMKARWDNWDFVRIRVKSLPFAGRDVAMIHARLARVNRSITEGIESSPLQ